MVGPVAPAGGDAPALDDGLLLALAYPERIARARGPWGNSSWSPAEAPSLRPPILSHGRPGWPSPSWAAATCGATRILLASPVEEGQLLAAFASQIEIEQRINESGGGRLRARRVSRLGRLVVREEIDEAPPPELVQAALLARIRAEGQAPSLGAGRSGAARACRLPARAGRGRPSRPFGRSLDRDARRLAVAAPGRRALDSGPETRRSGRRP